MPKKKDVPEEFSLAGEVKEQIDKIDEEAAPEDFVADEKQKLNIIRSHRRILHELWNNYTNIRDSGQESNKKNYLVAIADELVQIQKLENAEQDLMGALDEIRKIMDTEPPEEVYERILGWEVKRLVVKSADDTKVKELLGKLEKEIQIFLEDLEKMPKLDAWAKVEERLYGK